uniref:Uncharacterized protein n=1 Tax=Anguilla anguilla TaxID=7936 RepID=A0A0E9TJ68_ANGAN
MGGGCVGSLPNLLVSRSSILPVLCCDKE